MVKSRHVTNSVRLSDAQWAKGKTHPDEYECKAVSNFVLPLRYANHRILKLTSALVQDVSNLEKDNTQYYNQRERQRQTDRQSRHTDIDR